MPFRSVKQMHFLAAHMDKIGGKRAFHEWASKTNMKTLPEKVKSPKKADKQ